MSNYSFSINQRQTKRKGVAFDLYVRTNGRKCQPCLGYDLSKEEALRRAAAMIETILSNLNPPEPTPESMPTGPTLSDVLPIYWSTMKIEKRVETERPRLIISKHLFPFFGNIELSELEAQQGLAYVTHRQGQGAADGTIKREFNLIL